MTGLVRINGRASAVWSLLLIVVIFFGPLISVFSAGAIATMNGCALDEGGMHPCVVLGLDLGGTLYAMALTGWLGLLTVPIGILALIAWALALAAHFWKRRRRAG